MGRLEPYHEEAPAGGLEAEMDRLSLTQALHDFEVANARVVDLTQRLIGTGRELTEAREQLASLQRRYDELRTTHETMQRSRAFRLANRIWAIRNAL
ncbi:MAG TPA: hypothetical protein VFJ85_15905 [Acidimicrobiales bacterium]|nr:hypothetical protein [Acidimicrobiales bacterium]